MKDQWDCVLNVPEELCTGIFFYLHLLLPSILSIDRQTNEESVGTYSEYFPLILQKWTAPSSSRCTCWEWRRRYVTFLILQNRRMNISLVQCQSNSFSQMELFLVKSRQVLFFVVLFLPLTGMKNLFAFSFNVYSSSWTSGLSVSLLFKFITNLFDPWESLT